MPTYRKLHTKIVESLDVNDMPDDFHRLFWTLLPLALCREGRGLLNAAWLKSRVFPLREDIDQERVRTAFQWFIDHGMVEPYTAGGREYFYVPTFEKYQGTTIKEKESDYPPPPDWCPPESHPEDVPSQEPVQSGSGAGPEPVQSRSVTDSDANADADAKTDADNDNAAAAAPISSRDPPLQEFLAIFEKSRFDNDVQECAIAALGLDYDAETLLNVAHWARKKGMNLGQAVVAMPQALAKWENYRKQPGVQDTDRRRFIEGEYSEYIQH